VLLLGWLQADRTQSACEEELTSKQPSSTHPGVALLIEGQAEGDVVAQAQVLAPGVLGHVGHAATGLSSTLGSDHVAQNGVHQGGLAGTDTADHSHQLSGLAGELWDVEHEVGLAVVGELGVALQVARCSSEETQQQSLGTRRVIAGGLQTC
jgi:hypothetical protein